MDIKSADHSVGQMTPTNQAPKHDHRPLLNHVRDHYNQVNREQRHSQIGNVTPKERPAPSQTPATGPKSQEQAPRTAPVATQGAHPTAPTPAAQAPAPEQPRGPTGRYGSGSTATDVFGSEFSTTPSEPYQQCSRECIAKAFSQKCLNGKREWHSPRYAEGTREEAREHHQIQHTADVEAAKTQAQTQTIPAQTSPNQQQTKNEHQEALDRSAQTLDESKAHAKYMAELKEAQLTHKLKEQGHEPIGGPKLDNTITAERHQLDHIANMPIGPEQAPEPASERQNPKPAELSAEDRVFLDKIGMGRAVQPASQTEAPRDTTWGAAQTGEAWKPTDRTKKSTSTEPRYNTGIGSEDHGPAPRSHQSAQHDVDQAAREAEQAQRKAATGTKESVKPQEQPKHRPQQDQPQADRQEAPRAGPRGVVPPDAAPHQVAPQRARYRTTAWRETVLVPLFPPMASKLDEASARHEMTGVHDTAWNRTKYLGRAIRGAMINPVKQAGHILAGNPHSSNGTRTRTSIMRDERTGARLGSIESKPKGHELGYTLGAQDNRTRVAEAARKQEQAIPLRQAISEVVGEKVREHREQRELRKAAKAAQQTPEHAQQQPQQAPRQRTRTRAQSAAPAPRNYAAETAAAMESHPYRMSQEYEDSLKRPAKSQAQAQQQAQTNGHPNGKVGFVDPKTYNPTLTTHRIGANSKDCDIKECTHCSKEANLLKGGSGRIGLPEVDSRGREEELSRKGYWVYRPDERTSHYADPTSGHLLEQKLAAKQEKKKWTAYYVDTGEKFTADSPQAAIAGLGYRDAPHEITDYTNGRTGRGPTRELATENLYPSPKVGKKVGRGR